MADGTDWVMIRGWGVVIHIASNRSSDDGQWLTSDGLNDSSWWMVGQ